MADNLMGGIPTDFQPEMQDISRQQKMAQMLMQQAFQQPQGQMISGQYVAPAITQQLAPLFAAYVGSKGMEAAENKQTELAKAIRQGKETETASIMEDINAGRNKEALAKIQSSRFGAGKDLAGALVGNIIPKAQEPKVVGNRLVDPTGKVLYTAPKEYAPHAVQLVDTPQGMVQFDPNTRQVTPVMGANNQPLMGTKGNLPEGATKQVTGATNLKDAIDNYKTTLQGFSTLDMANPDARATMGNAYNNMMLQAKEAYNLGVLNGPDYAILQSVVKDPTKLSSVLVSKKALEQQATDLSKQADTIISNVFKTHNRPVPQNLQSKQPVVNAKQTQQFDPALLQYMTPEQQALFAQPGK